MVGDDDAFAEERVEPLVEKDEDESERRRGFGGELLAVGVGQDALERVLDVDAVVDVVQETDEIGVPSDDAVEEGEEALDEREIILAELLVEVEERGAALDALLVRLGSLEVAEVEEDVRVLGMLLGDERGGTRSLSRRSSATSACARDTKPVRLCNAVAFYPPSRRPPRRAEGKGHAPTPRARSRTSPGGRVKLERVPYGDSEAPVRVPARVRAPGCCCSLSPIGRGRGVFS